MSFATNADSFAAHGAPPSAEILYATLQPRLGKATWGSWHARKRVTNHLAL